MIRYFTCLLFILISFAGLAQTNQITISRINQMPDLPQPYVMRDWKDVALKYDQLVFYGQTGTYFPLTSIRSTVGVNYPTITPILMKTFVGTATNQAEGINIIPSLVGASLMGIDKSSQSGTNWVEKSKEFFNRANGQNVYLNNYGSTSGGDWWYDVMPNVFFYQLYSQYPTTLDFQTQFTTVADRWLQAVQAMGGSTTPWAVPNMNYRAFNLATMQGLADGVREPEAAGAIGWLLYHAYLETGEKKYLDGAQQSLEFLNGLTSNPSYELQLPYGAFVAAKMNAEQGTSYNISKMLNWCFDRGALRGWGAIRGQWDGKDVSGLIGEANDGGNDYAFALNGYQQAAALVPLMKYDKRFTRDLAKWTLNVANASRFFYRPYPTSQDDLAWSTTNDPDAVIGYEALKERDSHNGNLPLRATGDAKRNGWAATNLGLYGSSSVGYLAAVLDVTDVSGILLLDVNKTDFFLEESYPTYALYNPHTEDKVVTLTLPSGSHDIYNAISETKIVLAASGTTTVTVKADEAVLLTYVPAGTTLVPENGKLLANDIVIDHHYGYDFTPKLRIKVLDVAETLVEYGQQVPVYLTVDNAQGTVNYSWSDNQGNLGTFTTPAFTWTAPSITGENELVVEITSGSETLTASIVFNVVESIPEAPVISGITSESPWQQAGSQTVFTCNVTDDDDELSELDFEWSFTAGSLVNKNGATLTWQAPATQGVYEITCTVTDQDGLTATFTRSILVKNGGTGDTAPFAYYPFDINTNDYSGNNRHAIAANVEKAADARGESNRAYLFDSGTDIIAVDNSAALNFQDKITLSFWVKANAIPEECFILSHGSWEQRWKVSITPSGRLRWTVKTATATRDLDSSFPLTLNQFYHFTVVYSGFSMEVYADGELDAFTSHSGLMGISTNSLTFGKKDLPSTSYYLRGVLDEVRIYNATLSPDEISTLKDKWNEIVTGTEKPFAQTTIYPNPAGRSFYLSNVSLAQLTSVQLTDVSGKPVAFEAAQAGEDVKVSVTSGIRGVVILQIRSSGGIKHQKIILN